ncbi:colicin immunity domain-containing protein [Roseateles flavus]|uniref:Colicin immunity domain-containing protein n=1 Tax=Roseateles flavus TaxID=3149041 RepID=A0ABV0GH92_9BURK
MSDAKTEYEALIHQFLCGNLPVNEFQIEYMSKFKGEKRILSVNLYELLEEIFGCVDSFTTDFELLSEKPNFYMTESQLRERLQTTVRRLRLI